MCRKLVDDSHHNLPNKSKLPDKLISPILKKSYYKDLIEDIKYNIIYEIEDEVDENEEEDVEEDDDPFASDDEDEDEIIAPKKQIYTVSTITEILNYI